ncbi:achaete-scute homolog 3 [Parasteatoda tepidariorum]|uniref:achaete-scute homolog 3 n=1 Tax=Parasteatoda tepidariorum TaxID=114398 RepID=UPI001C718679|nr:achaete-scute homolog 3 [Parasteatoda tepidariorum]
MVSPSVSMTIPNDFASYPPVMSLPWVQQPPNPYKLFTPQINPYPSSDLMVSANRRKSAPRKGKQCYKHVPHKDKPPHLVARRNARERRRVQAVNSAFARLRKCVPIENRNKRLSKVKTLHKAIEYIKGLQMLLSDQSDSSFNYDTSNDDVFDLDEDVKDEREDSEIAEYLESDSVNKENKNQSWSSLSTDCESNYWTYNVPYHEIYPGSLPS